MSLAIGALVVVITIAIGTLIGLVAGASRIMDRVLMRIMDGVMAIPASCWRWPWYRCSAPAWPRS